MSNRWSHVAEHIGLAGLYLFSLSAFLSTSGGNIGLGLMLFAYILSFRTIWPFLKRDPVLLLFLCFLSYFFIRIVLAIHEFPETAERQIDSITDWLYLWLFLFVGWYFKGRMKRISFALGLAFIGFILGVAYRQDWSRFDMLIEGSRSGFGNQIPLMGLYSGTAILGLLFLWSRLWGPRKNRIVFALRILLWLVLLGGHVQILIITKSITSWIGFLVVLPLLLWFGIREYLKTRHVISRPHVALFASLMIIVLSVVIYTNQKNMIERLSSQREVVEQSFSLNLDDVPYTPGLGVRLHTYRYGFMKWLQRPFLGWGPGTEVAKFSDRPTQVLPHMHSTYLEILVRFGVVGFLILTAGAWCVARMLWRGYRTGQLPLDYFVFLAGTLGLLAVWCAGNFRMPTDWRFYCTLFTGICYSFSTSQDLPHSKYEPHAIGYTGTLGLTGHSQ